MAHPHPPRNHMGSHLTSHPFHHPIRGIQQPGEQLIGRCHQIAEEEGIGLAHIAGGCHEGGTCEKAQRLTVQRLVSEHGSQPPKGRDALLMAAGLPLAPRAIQHPGRAQLQAPNACDVRRAMFGVQYFTQENHNNVDMFEPEARRVLYHEVCRVMGPAAEAFRRLRSSDSAGGQEMNQSTVRLAHHDQTPGRAGTPTTSPGPLEGGAPIQQHAVTGAAAWRSTQNLLPAWNQAAANRTTAPWQELYRRARLPTIAEVPEQSQRALDAALNGAGATTPAYLPRRSGVSESAQAIDRSTASQAFLDEPRNATGNGRVGTGTQVQPNRQNSVPAGGPFINEIPFEGIQWD
ncbi:MAG: hypothetical protein Q9169_000232 [Polycauliona sp. 2 TL-2023]